MFGLDQLPPEVASAIQPIVQGLMDRIDTLETKLAADATSLESKTAADAATLTASVLTELQEWRKLVSGGFEGTISNVPFYIAPKAGK